MTFDIGRTSYQRENISMHVSRYEKPPQSGRSPVMSELIYLKRWSSGGNRSTDARV